MTRIGVRRMVRREGARANHAIVFLDGAQHTHMRPGRRIETMLTGYGNLIVINYPNGAFSAPDVVTQVCQNRAVTDAGHLTLIGVSMGGLIAYDIIAELNRNHWRQPRTVRLMLIDAPSCAADLYDKRAPLAPFLTWLPTLPERLNQKLMHGPTPLYDEGLLTAEEKCDFDEHLKRSHGFSFSLLVQQTAYIASHRGITGATLPRVRTVFLQSPRDTIVKPSAYRHWRQACGTIPPAIRVTASQAHADMLEFPVPWTNAIIEGMTYLHQQ